MFNCNGVHSTQTGESKGHTYQKLHDVATTTTITIIIIIIIVIIIYQF